MIVAVLGKTASGKSEIMAILRSKGFYCVYGDKITRQLYKRGQSGQKKIKKYFGDEFLAPNGEVNRDKLKKVVFDSPSKLKLLNKIIHPLIYKELISIIYKMPKGIDIAFELFTLDDKKLLAMVDKVIWAERSLKLIEKTLIKERGGTRAWAKKVMKLGEKPKRVDFVIKNNSDFSALNFLVTQALDL